MTRVIPIVECSYDIQVGSLDYDTTIWLGAGFSPCATNGEAPLMKGFFKGLDKNKYPHLSRYLSGRCGCLEDFNVESVLQAVEQLQDCPLPPRLRHSIRRMGLAEGAG